MPGTPIKLELKINTLLNEYTVLREESLMNFSQQQKSIIWIGAAIYGLFALIVQFPKMEILFVFFPFIIFAWLGFTAKSDCKIVILATYLDLISKKIDYLLDSSLMKWEDLAVVVIRRATTFKKVSSFILHIMVSIPFIIIFIYSYIKGHSFLSNLEDIKNKCLLMKSFDYGIPTIVVLFLCSIIWYFAINVKTTKEFCKNELENFKQIEKNQITHLNSKP